MIIDSISKGASKFGERVVEPILEVIVVLQRYKDWILKF